MSDSVPGPLAGFLFQFEKALVLLATLNSTSHIVSIEFVDDVAVHNDQSVVLMSVQSKHSVSPNGTTFEDTSKSLWRTLEIWIEKLNVGVFNGETQFICSTNKKIPDNFLVRKLQTNSFENVLSEVEALLNDQKEKLKIFESKKDGGSGASIRQTIKRIEYVLVNRDLFQIVCKNIRIQDDEDLKEKFFLAVHMTSDEYNDVRKASTFESMYGWVVSRSKSKWLNSASATFTKLDFDTKLAQVNSNPAIINAIFRKKGWLGSVDARIISETKKELFVAQIEDLKRNQMAKERKIEAAIHDFIYYDIEMTHIVSKGNFTEGDFEDFKRSCRDRWQKCADSHIIKELEDYSEENKNELAIAIFDSIMDSIEVNFQEGIPFTSDNRYIHNGTFLKLSNIPEIGWHPEWEIKYKK